jgi:hypothetical protein
MARTTFSGPVVSVAGFIGSQVTNAPVDITGATATVTAAAHAGKVVTINRAAGSALSLPAATGTGSVYTFVVGTTVTSNTLTISAAGTNKFQGRVYTVSDDTAAVKGWIANAAATNRVSLNGTTTGGYLGDCFVFTDIAAGMWEVLGFTASTSTEATPFAAV